MPKYISAYDLQQREGLSRREVLELAEEGPVFWRVHEAHIAHLDFCDRYPDADRRIDLAAVTTERLYWLDGFKKLKGHVLKDWNLLISKFRQSTERSIKKHGYLPDPEELCKELRLDDWLGNCLPDYMTGQEADKLFGKYCPAHFRDNPSGAYSKHSIIKCVTAEGKDESIFGAFHVYKMLDNEQFWIEIKHSTGIIFDLYFQPIFQEWLFFQEEADDNDVPACSAMGQARQAKDLPLFEVKKAVSKVAGPAKGRSTKKENGVALQYIDFWKNTLSWTELQIAEELYKKGAGNAVIGYLLSPESEDLSGIDNKAAAKRGRRARGLD